MSTEVHKRLASLQDGQVRAGVAAQGGRGPPSSPHHGQRCAKQEERHTDGVDGRVVGRSA